jgi:hypothetical protein
MCSNIHRLNSNYMSLNPSLRMLRLWIHGLGCAAALLFIVSCSTPEAATADKKAYTEDDPSYRKKVHG